MIKFNYYKIISMVIYVNLLKIFCFGGDKTHFDFLKKKKRKLLKNEFIEKKNIGINRIIFLI